jgi:hypothetical protein
MFQVIQERRMLLSDVTSKPPLPQTEEDISISEWTSNRILQFATSDSLLAHLQRGTTPGRNKAFGGMRICRRIWNTGKNPHLPQIPHELIWDSTITTAVRNQQLTAWVRSKDNSVFITTGYGLDVWGLIPWRGKIFLITVFILALRPTSLVSNGYWWLFPQVWDTHPFVFG